MVPADVATRSAPRELAMSVLAERVEVKSHDVV